MPRLQTARSSATDPASSTETRAADRKVDDLAPSMERSDPQVDGKSIATGNAMLGQSNVWYVGVALSVLFKYCAGMPDMPAFAIPMRPGCASLRTCVVVLGRGQVEAQVVPNWHSGLVGWRYSFRSAMTSSRTNNAYE